MPTRGGGVRAMATELTPTLPRPAMVGLIRGATVGLIVGIRESMWRLGVRMMLCAWTAELPESANGTTAAARSSAARRVILRQFTPSSTMGPRLTRARNLVFETAGLTVSPPRD